MRRSFLYKRVFIYKKNECSPTNPIPLIISSLLSPMRPIIHFMHMSYEQEQSKLRVAHPPSIVRTVNRLNMKPCIIMSDHQQSHYRKIRKQNAPWSVRFPSLLFRSSSDGKGAQKSIINTRFPSLGSVLNTI